MEKSWRKARDKHYQIRLSHARSRTEEEEEDRKEVEGRKTKRW